jgi:FkbM family methyltransferase
MNLRQLIKYVLWRDTTHHGEFPTMFRLLPPDAPKVVVDVGANDGFYGSNSFPFVARGWRGILIEPHPDAFALLKERFLKNPRVTCLNVACGKSAGQSPLYLGKDPSVSTLCTDPDLLSGRGGKDKTILVPVKTLADIMSASHVPHDFGVLTVDTEGMDYEVLLGLDCSAWRPRVIITEDYQPKEADKAAYLNKNGYCLRSHIAGNTIWAAS